ncbi:MAG TPA: TetR family transcriptional regulator [Acidimicrobiales bacterium]|jgi:TetR/AcrR family tetracycline transcriptional repressor|nr:TetR family transcriptional regulator [Acidimicrobiales bacterium]
MIDSAGRAPQRRAPWWLSSDKVIAKAIELLDEHGEAWLTMRRLAEALDVQAPALYGHVKSRDALMLAALDRVIGDFDADATADDRWDVHVRQLMSALREHLLAHPWAPRVASEIHPEALFILGERAQELMQRAGLRGDDAYRYRRLLVWTVWGFVAVEVTKSTAKSHTRVDEPAGPGRRYRVSFAVPPGTARERLPSPYDVVDLDELFAAAVASFIAGVNERVSATTAR